MSSSIQLMLAVLGGRVPAAAAGGDGNAITVVMVA